MAYQYCCAPLACDQCLGPGALLRWWLGILLLFLALAGQAAEPWEFRLFPNPNGVSIAEVNGICEDRDGAIWVATWGEGVHRIHGTEWKHFTESDGLPDNWVRSVCAARDGGVWIGTGEGLVRVRGNSMEVLKPDNFPLFQNADVYFVKELSNGQLWVGTSDNRVFVHTPDIGNTSDIRLGWKTLIEPGGFHGEKIHQLVEVDPNTLLISVRGQRLFWMRDGVLERDPFLGSASWYSIFKEKRPAGEADVLWAAARNGEGLYRYAAGSWVPQDRAIPGVNEMAQSDSGQVYAATSAGLHVRLVNGWEILEMGPTIGIPGVNNIKIDRSGAVWLGGKEGLIRGSLTSWRALTTTGKDSAPKAILSRLSAQSPHLAANFRGEIFQAVGGAWKPTVRLHPWDGLRWVQDNQIWPGNTELWKGNEERGLWLSVARDRIYVMQDFAFSAYSLEDGSRESHEQLTPMPEEIGYYFVSSDEQLLALAGDGVYKYTNGTWLPFPDAPDYKHRRVHVVVEAKPGVFYAGLQDGIERWTESGVEYFGEAHGINTEDYIHAICPTPSGEIWFGSFGSGVYRYDGATFQQLSRAEGLQHNSVRSIFAASDGAIWIAYRRKGLSKYVNGRWTNYSVENGLPNAAAMGFAEGPLGNIWIGSQEQRLYQYLPDSEGPETYIDIGAAKVGTHGIGVFSFSAWDAWNQTLVRDLRYSWRVVPRNAPSDPKFPWPPFQSKTTVVTESMPPGDYRFEVRSTDENGNIDPTAAQFSFSVAASFWKRPLFFIPLLCSTILAVIALIFRWFSHRALLKSEAALLEANRLLLLENRERERLLMAIEQAAETIVITDVDGTIRYANPAFEHTTGYLREDVIGQDYRTLRSGEHDDAFYAEIYDDLRNGKVWSGRIINKKKDGTLFTEEVTISPVHDVSGKTISHVAIKRDITRESELEEQLMQAQKMEAVGQLAGGVAHDFNNLLQVILGYGDMALDEAEADSPIRVSIEEIVKAGQRAATLTRQLLAFSRRQVLDMKDVDLNDVIVDLLKMLRRLIGEHITLNVVAAHDLGTVRADPGQIGHILMNLCVNARDAMPAGGIICIETENVELDEAFCEAHSWVTPGRYAALRVTDTGCGMDKETMANAFEPFFTTKDVGEGTGLGLSTVYGLVKQHEGMTHVYSEVNKGTTVKIYLPLIESSVVTSDDMVEAPVTGGTETILLAEDEASIRDLSQAILEQAGYTVLTACDGKEALRVFWDHTDEVDMLLLDVIMPHLGGRAVFEKIKEMQPGIRVLFSSGYSMNAIHTSFVLDKDLVLIQKPYQRDDLLRRVRETLDHDDTE